MKRRVSLPYGDREIQFDLEDDNLSDILTPTDPEVLPEPRGEIRRALADPIGSERLASLVRADSRVVIISDDNTRPTPAHLIVPELLRELAEGGVAPERVKLIVASGTHRLMARQELARKLGEAVLDLVEVVNHDYRVLTDMVELGVTAGGTPISVNRAVMEADVVVGVGSIVPHHVPGFSGGAKIVQPGVCGEATTAATHLASVRKCDRSFLGILENPIREEMEAVADAAGVRYIFNTVLDRHGRLVRGFFGDVRLAFREGVRASVSVYGVPVRRRTPIVVASSSPCDLEFWQAHKTLYPSDMVVEEGGMVIVVTPCPEGVAVTHPELLEFAGRSPEEIDGMIDRGEIGDAVAASAGLQWSKMRQRAEICLVSDGITAEEAARLGFSHADSVETALKRARDRYGRSAPVNILTNAPDTLPLIA